MMKQLLASVTFLYEEILNESVDFDFNIKMEKPRKIPVLLGHKHISTTQVYSHMSSRILKDGKSPIDI